MTRPPIVGDKLWYRPSPWDKTGPGAMQVQTGKPLDATIVAVNSATNINLVVFDAAGHMHRRTSVTLVHDRDPNLPPGTGVAYAEWVSIPLTYERDLTEATTA